MIPALVLAGVASGVGKTTLTLGLIEALRRRGLTVQPFKIGPDFIDPGFHALVSGRPSHNLDGWMCSEAHVRATVACRAADADLALIEGVMGCFDGRDATSDAGSTAEVAKWLGAPVVLVVDAAAMAKSAGAIVLGFEEFDPDLDLAGVVFNRVAGETHWQWLREAVSARCRAVPLGFLPRRDSLDPSRAAPRAGDCRGAGAAALAAGRTVPGDRGHGRRRPAPLARAEPGRAGSSAAVRRALGRSGSRAVAPATNRRRP